MEAVTDFLFLGSKITVEFDFFMESMINEFLNSCSIANAEQNDSVDNVEKTEKSA